MSKFCKNCGAVLNDEMMFCNSCGAQQDVPVAQEPVAEAKANPIDKLKALGTKKLAILGGIAVGVIAVVVILIVLLSSLGGYNKAVDNYEAVLNGKADKIADLAPEEYWAAMAKQTDTSKSKYLDEKIDKYEDSYSDQVESWEDEVGKNPKVTMKVLDKEKIDKDDLEDI
ncbi:MAG: zinc ribbon domain-containing protein, partial [Ruminococcaceae bacterium]|nr:zinc ribbon domain-containing protein [Oscillospiraceae bacterium]